MKIGKPADLARLVKTRRQALGRTQQDVADAAGITRQSLARIERGHGGVSFDTLLLILDHLGIRLDGTPSQEADTRALSPAGTHSPELPTARLTQGIDTSAFAQAALRQLAPSFDAVAVSATEAVRSILAAAGASAPLRAPLSTITDDASRAILRSEIEAGNPNDRRTGEDLPASDDRDEQ
ncbi:MAG: helix-turn-helix transcriptional regulator [Actinomycetota bacterium]